MQKLIIAKNLTDYFLLLRLGLLFGNSRNSKRVHRSLGRRREVISEDHPLPTEAGWIIDWRRRALNFLHGGCGGDTDARVRFRDT